MKPRSCKAIRASFSEYLDGAVSGLRMQQIARHIEGFENEALGKRTPGCEECARELAAWRATQEALGAMGPAQAPADLALRLRIAISHEHARRNSRLLDRLSLAWENALRPMLLQVAGGLVGSVVLIGSIALLSAVAAPTQVLANDEPLGALTTPHLLYSTASPEAILTENDTAVIVEASVDTHGRVYDYTIVAGPQDQGVRTQVANQLLGSVFQPASAFGVPVRGRVVLTFAGISVHG
jgi:hypothetical protein